MKCTECPDYRECSRTKDLRRYRSKCQKAKEIKVYTRADRIRAMSDDELAEMIMGVSHGVEPCNYCEPTSTFGQECGMTSVCKDGVMNWLRMPAEG